VCGRDRRHVSQTAPIVRLGLVLPNVSHAVEEDPNTPNELDAFMEFATEFADGERWKLLRAQGWDDFEQRLAEALGDLPVRRRQALIMLLFALVESFVAPADVREWLDGHDVSTHDGLEALITWLREKRPLADG
jgi:hypothetical protein